MPLPPWPHDLLPELAARAAARPAVVIDDDPTGTQTLRDVTVLTAWDSESVARHLDEGVVFLSTNSRSLEEAAATAITHDAAVTASGASRIAGRPISLISRSDSTLRGHFPAETHAIATAMGWTEARTLLAPYFGEGGRVTVDDVHYLERDGAREPVGETEFARDAVFGYRSSNLGAWVREKAGGAAPPTVSLPLELIRAGGPQAVADALGALSAGGVAIANAELDRDIEVVALGSLLAEERGIPIVARAAASYVRVRAGRPVAELLTAEELAVHGPGLIVVGSHVPTTTRQLEHLLGSRSIWAHELPVAPLMAGRDAAEQVILRAVGALRHAVDEGRTAMVATERTRRDTGLAGARAISSALVEVVRRVDHPPAWVIAKGGITSSDIASRALEMREARVAGQVLAGVPVWVGSAAGSRWPGVPLVVFPGNVGGADALTRVVQLLEG